MAGGIYAKVAELQKRVGQFGKDKKNPHFKYSYASAEGVNERIKPLLVELGIITELQVSPAQVVGNVLVAQAFLKLIDPADGSFMMFASIGSGTDSGDKHAMKAATAAQKYATIAAAFGSSTDDPEADGSVDAQRASESLKDRMAAKPEVYGTAAQLSKQHEEALAPVNPGETLAVVIGVVSDDGITRTGRQPFKLETDQGVFQSFDRKQLEKITQGSIVIYKTTKWGNDIVEVKNEAADAA